MNNEKITESVREAKRFIELAKLAGCVPLHEDGDSTLMFTQKTLQRFAELVRAEALNEAIQVLEFHGFDDAIPYVRWAAVNGRSMK